MGSAGQSHTNSSRQGHTVQPSPSAAPGTRASGKRGQQMWLCSDHEAPEVTEGGAGPALGIELDQKLSLRAEVN